jgi:AcrR family transcriptional regulator
LRQALNRDSLLGEVAYRPTDRTEARRLATRERIVAAALAQMGEGGYGSAGVQAVAARAGVAVGTVYRHFPSKGDLFAEAFRRASQRELDVVVAVSEGDGHRGAAGQPAACALRRSARERVAAAVEAFARRALAGPVLAYALLAEPVDPAVEAERLRFRTGYRDAFARVLDDGVRDGELRPHDTATVAAAFVGALGEALVGPLSAVNGKNGSKEALIATLVQFSEEALPRAHERVHA